MTQRITRMVTLCTSLLVLLAFAGSALAQGPADPVERLIELFETTEGYFEARQAAVVDPSLSDEALETVASHPDWQVRTQASILLGWRHQAELFSEVFATSSTPGRQGRRHRYFNEAFLDPAARPAIIERLLRGGEPGPQRAGLVNTLVGLHDYWAQDMVGLLGAVEDDDVLFAAVGSFRWAQPEAAAAGLRLALLHRRSTTRSVAASTVGWRADGAVLAEELGLALSDSSGSVRAMAARSLGWLRVSVSVEGLEPLLDDPEPEVRLHALRALDRIAPRRAEADSRLGRLVRDSDPKVARVARRISARTR